MKTPLLAFDRIWLFMLVLLCHAQLVKSQDEVGFITTSWYIYPVDNGTYVAFSGDKLAECTATFINNTNTDDCAVNLEFDCNFGDCAFGRCSVGLDLPGSNQVRWYALKTPSGQSVGSQFYDWKDNNMVSSLDMSRILAHIEESAPFFSMIQYIQADVNGDGVIDEDNDVELIQDVLLGTMLPPIPPWTFVSNKWIDVFEDFEYNMYIYEPSTEEFEEFYENWKTAFNRMEGGVLQIGRYQTLFSSSELVLDWFHGFKLGDVNYSATPYDVCGGCISDGDVDVRSSSNVKSIQTEIHAKYIGYTTEIEFYVDRISDIHALQFEIPFGNSDVEEIRLAQSSLPFCSEKNYYFDKEANILRFVWIDRKHDRTLRDVHSDEKVTLSFYLYSQSGVRVEVLEPTSQFNVAGMYGSFQEIPLIFDLHEYSTSGRQSPVYLQLSNYIEFHLAYDDCGEYDLFLYTTSGQLICARRSSAFHGIVSFDLRDFCNQLHGCFIYQLNGRHDNHAGRLIVMNE